MRNMWVSGQPITELVSAAAEAGQARGHGELARGRPHVETRGLGVSSHACHAQRKQVPATTKKIAGRESTGPEGTGQTLQS